MRSQHYMHHVMLAHGRLPHKVANRPSRRLQMLFTQVPKIISSVAIVAQVVVYELILIIEDFTLKFFIMAACRFLGFDILPHQLLEGGFKIPVDHVKCNCHDIIVLRLCF